MDFHLANILLQMCPQEYVEEYSQIQSLALEDCNLEPYIASEELERLRREFVDYIQ